MNPRLHDELSALCAVYYSGEISEQERALVQIHLAYCKSCRERFLEYREIVSGVVPALAAAEAREFAGKADQWFTTQEEAERSLMARLNSSSGPKKKSSRGRGAAGDPRRRSSRRARRDS